ncbi:MAG: glycoside hydrolase [Ignavibacteria bacterium]|jgi:sialate O-acetylesterase|nr:glycoside hydrolase [Ignavibacteria bacterium]MCU7499381.1 glycoside hydrolase [Ignavibacteria bacterium]MCU7513468.1 glycoside hydrolase [Ignavibacteria bacterium]MCU7518918.1 glycoside hydrolase [Ignavibacteria bacterium]MCU7525140.1 glycoside hydrolase [Ignavibacteria bacterium]
MIQNKLKLFVITASVLTMLSQNAFGQESQWKAFGLKGKWKFSIGDDKKWARPDFNDKAWEEIYAPSPWEDQGFHGYDGYAWYRKHFYCPASVKGKSLLLQMGFIDDVDEIYINGKLVGSTGSFPPEYQTAYDAERRYPVPESILKISADNVIAVRVYDAELGGGIMSGELGLFVRQYPIWPDVALEGYWKFRTGDSPEWKNKDFQDNAWNEIVVPAFWENQGYANYDGFAWYRKKVVIPSWLNGKQLVLMLGKIDDKDEVYFNGRLIGRTGDLREESTNDRDYQMFRGYYIPKDIITNGNNTIAVRVYDGFRDGGIYQGPIGITTQEKYNQMWRKQKKHKSFWELFF